MAKQSGIHQIKGKVGKMSYYRQKGVTDGLARSINEGLSNRVKTAEEYENTRLNAAEFGSAASFAGACIRAISERKRSMLKNFATGDLAKNVREVILTDSTNDWGQRQLVGNLWQTLLRHKIATYAKLPYSEYVGGDVSCSVAPSESGNVVTTTLNVPAGWGELLLAKGATDVQVTTYVGSVTMFALGDAPFKSERATISAGETSEQIGSAGPISFDGNIGTFDIDADGDDVMSMALVVVKPFKTIGGKMHILQELCTYTIVQPAINE